MTGTALKAARESAGWSQARLAAALGVTQAYVSLLESSRRRVSEQAARKVARLLDMPPTALPLGSEPTDSSKASNDRMVAELSRLGYPGFAYLRAGRPSLNPAHLLLEALALEGRPARVTEALPWVLLRFDDLDTDYLVRNAKLHDLQNRLGFMVALARQVAEHNPTYHRRTAALRDLEQRLERSRLAREEALDSAERGERVSAWLRDHRSDSARHWNLLTDLKAEHLAYA